VVFVKTANAQFLRHVHEVFEQIRGNVSFPFVDEVENAFEEVG
jgi:hypothetical protein